jgi:hypothetical protein
MRGTALSAWCRGELVEGGGELCLGGCLVVLKVDL